MPSVTVCSGNNARDNSNPLSRYKAFSSSKTDLIASRVIGVPVTAACERFSSYSSNIAVGVNSRPLKILGELAKISKPGVSMTGGGDGSDNKIGASSSSFFASSAMMTGSSALSFLSSAGGAIMIAGASFSKAISSCGTGAGTSILGTSGRFVGFAIFASNSAASNVFCLSSLMILSTTSWVAMTAFGFTFCANVALLALPV